MKLILEAIKALFRKVENAIEDVRKSIPEAVQSDWSQNDKTAPDYVKNRTHYEGILEIALYDGKASNDDDILPDTWTEYSLEEGVERIVVVDGIRYEVVSFLDHNSGLVTLGAPSEPSENGLPDKFDFTEYPFSIYNYYDEPWVLRARFPDNKEHALRIVMLEEGVQKLDSKYLPDDLLNDMDGMKNEIKDIQNSPKTIKISSKNDSPFGIYNKCLEAYNRGDNIIFVRNDWEYEFYRYDSTVDKFCFRAYDPDAMIVTYLTVSRNSVYDETEYFTKTIEINGNSGNNHIPTALAVYNAVYRNGIYENFVGMTATGSYNKYSSVYERIEKNVVKSTLGSGIYCAVADSYIFNENTKLYELVNPTLRQGLYSTPVGKYIMTDFTGSLYAGDAYKGKHVYKVVEQRGGNDNGWSIVVDAYTVFKENTTDRGEFVHVVGNGTSNANRSNAHTLDWDGNAWYAGSVEGKAVILPSTTDGSTKRFQITVDDSGTITAAEITE